MKHLKTNCHLLIILLITTINFKISYSQPPPCATCCVPVITVTSAPTMEASLQALSAQDQANFASEKIQYEAIIQQAQKSYEIYTQISAGIKGMKEMINFFSMEINLITDIKRYASLFQNSPYTTPKDIEMIGAFYKGIAKDMESIKDVIQQYTKSDNKMSAGDRIEGITMALKKMTSIAIKVNYFNKKMSTYLEKKAQEDEVTQFLKNIH